MFVIKHLSAGLSSIFATLGAREGVKITYSITLLRKLLNCHALPVERKKQDSLTCNLVGKKNLEAKRNKTNYPYSVKQVLIPRSWVLTVAVQPQPAPQSVRFLGSAGGKWLTLPEPNG